MKILFGWIVAIGVAFPVFIVPQALMQTAPGDQSHSMQQDSQPASLAKAVNQGEKKIAGCLRQESGKFALDNGRRKVWLSGPGDFAAHAGHTVTLYGNFLHTSVANSSANTDANTNGHSSNHPSTQETDFQVTRIEMVSATCKSDKSKASQGSGPH
jgi:hypothetical protein